MSVFSAIKGKLVNVQQDLSNSIHLPFRTTKAEGSNKGNKSSGTANINAGAELLAVNQKIWTEIHLLSEENAHKAQELDSVITGIFLKLDKENNAVNALQSEAEALENLVIQVSTTKDQMEKLSDRFQELESALAVLEDICDEMQLKKNTVEHEFQLTRYRQRKNLELEQAKIEMAKRHAGKVREGEEQLNRMLRERQKVFDEAFREQMQNYKKVGIVDVQVPHPSAAVQNSVDLADIAIEDDPAQLDSFLDTSEPSSAVEGDSQPPTTDNGNNEMVDSSASSGNLNPGDEHVTFCDSNDNQSTAINDQPRLSETTTVDDNLNTNVESSDSRLLSAA